jgi:uncharacterized protein YmfQ (DUF2313 family)
MPTPTELQIQEHAQGLEHLRPPGIIWTSDPASVSRKFFMALATELARVTGRASDLIQEMDPRTTTELIPDWERVLNIPGDCEEPGRTLALRQFAVTTKLTQEPGQSRQDFIDLAASLGFQITIQEYLPFQVTNSVVGEALSNGEWLFTWTVHQPIVGGEFLRAGQGFAGEALLDFNQDTLQCFLQDASPAHTQLTFTLDLPWSGYAPWQNIFPDPAVATTNAITALSEID